MAMFNSFSYVYQAGYHTDSDCRGDVGTIINDPCLFFLGSVRIIKITGWLVVNSG